jgi:hypothetical protein
MDFNKLQISEFDLKSMVEHPTIVIIAKRGSGKSWITRDILYANRDIPGGIVIAPTDRMNGDYKKFFPDIYIHYNVTENILNKVLCRQTEMIEKKERKRKIGRKIDPRCVVTMDDCISSKDVWKRIQAISEILLNGRHFRILYILTMQDPLGIPPALRLNFDYVFLLKENSTINKKKLYQNYASMFATQDIFERVFAKTTENYKAMVIDNRKQVDAIQEQVYWFKAKERRFTFGSKEFRRLHDKYYDKHYLKKQNEELIKGAQMFGGKKKNDGAYKIEVI